MVDVDALLRVLAKRTGGTTNQEIALRSGLSPNDLSVWKRTKRPTLAKLARAAQALGLTLDTLIAEISAAATERDLPSDRVSDPARSPRDREMTVPELTVLGSLKARNADVFQSLIAHAQRVLAALPTATELPNSVTGVPTTPVNVRVRKRRKKRS